MLVSDKRAWCHECIFNPKVSQPDGTEQTEKWICDQYPAKIPTRIIGEGSECEHYINGDY